MSEDQRTFSRVETRLRAMARRTASADSLGLFRTSGRRDSGLASRLSSSTLPKELVEFLLEIDVKLDQLLACGRQDALRQDFPLDLEIHDISGAGIRFLSAEEFTPGEALEVIVILNHFPLRMAGAVGRVKDKDREGGLWGFEFTGIREADLEAIVQFVFQEQREIIRHRKWS